MKTETDDRVPEHNNRKLQTVCLLAATDGRYFLQGLEEGSSRFRKDGASGERIFPAA